jgi:pimeloyl-ACP methyl ester carboxylesterase
MTRRLILLPLLAATLAAQEVPERFRELYEDVRDNAYMQKQLAFLFEHMPQQDRETLAVETLRDNVFYAITARGAHGWAMGVPNELFQNYVLPYAQADEKRENWRKAMYERCAPLVADCKTPGEAAKVLNEQLFDLVDVHYSTRRRRALQAPGESIAQGRATCTGLSILLADACRSVGVPARIVSVKWPHKAGNHTWVEIWDGNRWRFCGADEPDPKGFDRAWFVGDARQCDVEDKRNRIYAVSFANTGTTFVPGWSATTLPGTDVTWRYDGTLPNDTNAPLLAQLGRYFRSEPRRQREFEFDRNLDEELRTRAGDARLRALVWRALREFEHASLRGGHADGQLQVAGKTTTFALREVGEEPDGGWPLVITLLGDAKAEAGYFHDAPKAGGYLRCDLQAPEDRDAIAPTIERLIRQCVICSGVDPGRVVLVGHGAGGDAAILAATRIPHRFAAVHASAAAPRLERGAALSLHSLPLTLVTSAEDTTERLARTRTLRDELAKLRAMFEGEEPKLWTAAVTLVDGRDRRDLGDRDMLAKLVTIRRGAMRNPPAMLAGPHARHHYNLHVETTASGVRIESTVADGMWTFRPSKAAAVSGWFDARTLDLSRPFSFVDESEQSSGHYGPRDPSPSLRVLCATMQQVGDPWLAATWIPRKIP